MYKLRFCTQLQLAVSRFLLRTFYSCMNTINTEAVGSDMILRKPNRLVLNVASYGLYCAPQIILIVPFSVF